MIYQNYSGLPKRAYPLNGIPLLGIPGIVPAIPPPAYTGGGGWIVPDLRKRERERRREILEDDQEILEMLAAIFPIINN